MSAHRIRILESFGNAPAMLDGALRRFPRRMWFYRESPDCPSIHDRVWHIAETETVEYVNCGRFSAEPHVPMLEIDSSRWISRRRYFFQNVKDGLGIFRVLRRALYHRLQTLPEAAWAQTADLPILGRLCLERWIEIRETYVPEQIREMERIHSEWLNMTSSRAITSARRAWRSKSLVS
jgi:DinB family protein